MQRNNTVPPPMGDPRRVEYESSMLLDTSYYYDVMIQLKVRSVFEMIQPTLLNNLHFYPKNLQSNLMFDLVLLHYFESHFVDFKDESFRRFKFQPFLPCHSILIKTINCNMDASGFHFLPWLLLRNTKYQIMTTYLKVLDIQGVSHFW